METCRPRALRSPADAGGGDAFAERGGHASGHKDILRHGSGFLRGFSDATESAPRTRILERRQGVVMAARTAAKSSRTGSKRRATASMIRRARGPATTTCVLSRTIDVVRRPTRSAIGNLAGPAHASSQVSRPRPHERLRRCPSGGCARIGRGRCADQGPVGVAGSRLPRDISGRGPAVGRRSCLRSAGRTHEAAEACGPRSVGTGAGRSRPGTSDQSAVADHRCREQGDGRGRASSTRENGSRNAPGANLRRRTPSPRESTVQSRPSGLGRCGERTWP